MNFLGKAAESPFPFSVSHQVCICSLSCPGFIHINIIQEILICDKPSFVATFMQVSVLKSENTVIQLGYCLFRSSFREGKKLWKKIAVCLQRLDNKLFATLL